MIAWAITDKGISRRENQDSYHLELSHSLATCVVCDGMGGAKSGNVASAQAVDMFMNQMTLHPGVKSPENALINAAGAANLQVYDKAQKESDCYGMGTTLVGAVVTPQNAVIVNVGDSRAYKISSAGIEQITRDHSLVEEMLKRGELTREEARFHPSKNLITRALGTEPHIKPDIFTVLVEEGDFIMLCTDGLTNVMDDQEILFEVMHGGDPALCCERLVETCNNRGGPDNITIVMIHI